MNEQQRADLAYVIHDAEHEVKMERTYLVKAARSLAFRMSQLADELEERPDYSVNGLGEVQGRGAEVDRRCALLSQKREALERVRHLVSRLELLEVVGS